MKRDRLQDPPKKNKTQKENDTQIDLSVCKETRVKEPSIYVKKHV